MRHQEAYIVYLGPSPLIWSEKGTGVANSMTKAGNSESGHANMTIPFSKFLENNHNRND